MLFKGCYTDLICDVVDELESSAELRPGVARTNVMSGNTAAAAPMGWMQKHEGIVEESRSVAGGTLRLTSVHTAAAEQLTGKKQGRYLTLDWPAFRMPDAAEHQMEMIRSLQTELQRLFVLHGIGAQSTVLVAGLGNRSVTPDALGPAVIERLTVTTHFFREIPHLVKPGTRPVCAIAPGVLGTTGMETSEVIGGIVRQIRPDAMIVVDALATASLARLHASVQMTDTGIQPGSGVGNKRKPFDRETFGIPVIAVGMPTVMYASSLIKEWSGLPGSAGVRSKPLEEFTGGMILTPKTTGQLIEFAADCIADVLNGALHQPF